MREKQLQKKARCTMGVVGSGEGPPPFDIISRLPSCCPGFQVVGWERLVVTMTTSRPHVHTEHFLCHSWSLRLTRPELNDLQSNPF